MDWRTEPSPELDAAASRMDSARDACMRSARLFREGDEEGACEAITDAHENLQGASDEVDGAAPTSRSEE